MRRREKSLRLVGNVFKAECTSTRQRKHRSKIKDIQALGCVVEIVIDVSRLFIKDANEKGQVCAIANVINFGERTGEAISRRPRYTEGIPRENTQKRTGSKTERIKMRSRYIRSRSIYFPS